MIPKISALCAFLGAISALAAAPTMPPALAAHFVVPKEFDRPTPAYASPLRSADGSLAGNAEQWGKRRAEILHQWHGLMGEWPALLQNPKWEWGAQSRRDSFTEHKVRVEIARGEMLPGILLVPDGAGPFPAVLVPFYDAETGAGLGKAGRDFGLQLSRRGFVSLSIGSPGGDARKPEPGRPLWQPLSYLAYVAANCHTALSQLPKVDGARIGVVGHSYGGKWAMFASCLHDKFACGAWSDPGIVFEEARSNINYWEPWYLGRDASITRKPGVVTAANPRTGAYKVMMEKGRDLHELHVLMAPRPFLVSGGSEDPQRRWLALRHCVDVNKLLGVSQRVGMTNRPMHDPTEESNAVLVAFFEHFLGGK